MCSINRWVWRGVLQLGIGSTSDAYTPATVNTANAMPSDGYFEDIAVGGAHACLVSSNTLGYYFSCWGRQAEGQLGNAVTSSTPLTAPNQYWRFGNGPYYPAISSITCGGQHTCLIQSSGAECVGANQYGQVGLGGSPLSTNSYNIFAVGSGTLYGGAVQVAAGLYHTCALLTKGVVQWCVQCVACGCRSSFKLIKNIPFAD